MTLSKRSFEQLAPGDFQLSNHLFEELAMDVYDEVDRRENDSGNKLHKS